MKDLLSQVYIHNDIPTRALSSDATSDGSVGDGVGVSITGFKRAVAIGTIGNPGDSDDTAVLRVQYAAAAVASDNVDSDYSDFSTDVVSAALTFATSDLAAGEGIAVIDIDLAAHGLTGGCIRTQFITQGTAATATGSSWILLCNRNGKALAQTLTVVTFP